MRTVKGAEVRSAAPRIDLRSRLSHEGLGWTQLIPVYHPGFADSCTVVSATELAKSGDKLY